MKIYKGQVPVYPDSVRKQTGKGSVGSEFHKIMDQLTPQAGKKGVEAGKEVPGPVAANGILIMHGAERAKGVEYCDRKAQILNELQDTLDMVDFYAGKLGDSSVSASGLSPLIEHLEARMGGLRDTGASSETPERLRSIITDMTVTIGSEIEKFKRGDYL